MKPTNKGKHYYSCPFCQAERDGVSQGWGMSPAGWDEMERVHDGQHDKIILYNGKNFYMRFGEE